MPKSPDDETKEYPLRIDVTFDTEEKGRYKKFLRDTGLKSGPFVRTLLIAAMDKEKDQAAS